MKRINNALILTIILFLQNTINGQDYYPFPEENAFWGVLEWDYLLWDYQFYFYTIEGDTTYNGKSYKKILKLDDDGHDTIKILHSFIRQDTSERRIYFIRHYLNETKEKLGYCFTGGIGDTVSFPAFDYNNIGDSSFIIRKPIFDSTLLNNGKYRKNYYFSSIMSPSSHFLQVIESIGSINCPFPCISFLDPFHQAFLTCQKVDYEVLYGTPKVCQFSVNIDENRIEVVDVAVYPVPAEDYIILKLSKNVNLFQINIFNMIGVLLQQIKVNHCENPLSIKTSDLTNGLYFLEIITKEKTVNIMFLVKH